MTTVLISGRNHQHHSRDMIVLREIQNFARNRHTSAAPAYGSSKNPFVTSAQVHALRRALLLQVHSENPWARPCFDSILGTLAQQTTQWSRNITEKKRIILVVRRKSFHSAIFQLKFRCLAAKDSIGIHTNGRVLRFLLSATSETSEPALRSAPKLAS